MDHRRTNSTACTGVSARLEVSAQNRQQELEPPPPGASCPEYLGDDCVIKALWPYDQEFIADWRSSSVELSIRCCHSALPAEWQQEAACTEGKVPS